MMEGDEVLSFEEPGLLFDEAFSSKKYPWILNSSEYRR